jgi:hypothetical protein
MTKTTHNELTDTQLILLSAASQRDDGIIALQERLKGAVATSVGERLLALGLAMERPTESGQPAWRQTADGERWTLFIAAAGLVAIGVADPEIDGADDNPPSSATAGAGEPGASRPAQGRERPARRGSKKALVIGLLGQGQGASIDDIAGMTGWLAHTIRAFLTGLRKAGMAVETLRQSGEPTRYRLTEGQGAETITIPPVGTVEPGQAEAA